MYAHGRKTHATARNTPHTPDYCSYSALTQRRCWHSLGPVLAEALPRTTLSTKRGGGAVTLYMQGGGYCCPCKQAAGTHRVRKRGGGRHARLLRQILPAGYQASTAGGFSRDLVSQWGSTATLHMPMAASSVEESVPDDTRGPFNSLRLEGALLDFLLASLWRKLPVGDRIAVWVPQARH